METNIQALFKAYIIITSEFLVLLCLLAFTVCFTVVYSCKTGFFPMRQKLLSLDNRRWHRNYFLCHFYFNTLLVLLKWIFMSLAIAKFAIILDDCPTRMLNHFFERHSCALEQKCHKAKSLHDFALYKSVLQRYNCDFCAAKQTYFATH